MLTLHSGGRQHAGRRSTGGGFPMIEDHIQFYPKAKRMRCSMPGFPTVSMSGLGSLIYLVSPGSDVC